MIVISTTIHYDILNKIQNRQAVFIVVDVIFRSDLILFNFLYSAVIRRNY